MAERNPAAVVTWKLVEETVKGQKRSSLLIADAPVGALMMRQENPNAVLEKMAAYAVSRFLVPAAKTAMHYWKAQRRLSRQWSLI